MIVCYQLNCFAQSQKQILNSELCSSPKIEWINEINSESVNSSNSGIFNSIYEIIVGNNDVQIHKPFSLISDSNKSIYFLDQDSKSLLKYSYDDGTLQALLDDDIHLKSPVGLCMTDRDLVFTDSETDNIYKYNLETEETKIINSSIQQPTGIIYINETKQLWVCETKQHRIVKLNLDGDIIGTLGERGIEDSQFNFPAFLNHGSDGNIYINDCMNFRIQIFSKDGRFIRKFGNAGDGSGDFARSKGIATDSYNNIYVVDALFNNIQVYDQLGNLLYAFGGQGTDVGKFWLPAGIFIDNTNKIFVADSYNARIQIFQLNCVN